MSWYRSGTIAVTNGSTAVVGTSTAFIANVAIGEGLLAPDGKVYEITAVTSDTGLTLGSAYLGSNSSGQTYAIIPSQSYVRDLATQAATLVNSYQSVKDNAGSGKFGDGTVGSPGVQFLSDSDTGIRRTGANAIALVTGGADRVTVDANGTLAVTNSSSANAVTITQTGTGNALVVEDSASTDSTPFVIDASGRVIVGKTVAHTGAGSGAGLQIQDLTFASRLSSASTNGALLVLQKSRGTIGAESIVLSGDECGNLSFYGYDGANWIQAALVGANIDGTPGTNDMPGRLVFSTTADGASSPTEALRIDSSQNIGIGGASFAGARTRIRGMDASTTGYGIYIDPSVLSTTTAAYSGISTGMSVANAVFTLPDLRHFYADQGTKGASATVTNQYGFQVASSLTGATNNYGFYSNIAAASNRWNFYAGGTAPNYFAGQTTVGTTASDAAATFLVKGTAYGIRLGTDVGKSFIEGVDNTGSGSYQQLAVGGSSILFSISGTAKATLNSSGNFGINTGTAIPAGGTAGVGLNMSSAANFGVFFGSGAPTLSAAKGSLYLRSDGSTTNDRMYVNTNGSTTWTAVTTAA